MPTLKYEAVALGDELPSLEAPVITRETLALFAGASGDHNPIHIDLDFARAAGMPDVFAHGMLGMAWVGRLLTNWAPQSQLRSFEVRFVGITHLGHVMRCTGEVTEKFECDGERCVRVSVRSLNQYGETKVSGEAVIALQ